MGLAEHPGTGGVYAVENSADGVLRAGVDIHEDNPGEEMNFLGVAAAGNGSGEGEVGGNYGYPDCFALWDADGFPDRGNLTVGSQFALDPGGVINDAACAADYVPPRLTFQVRPFFIHPPSPIVYHRAQTNPVPTPRRTPRPSTYSSPRTAARRT